MAIAKVAEWANQSASGSATTLVITVTSTVPVGEHVVVFGGINVVGTTLAVTDSKGNTYTTHADESRATGTPATTLAVASAKITTELVNGDTITMTFGTTGGGRVGRAVHYSGMKATGWFDQVGALGGNPAVSSNHTVAGLTTPADGALLLALVLLENTSTTAFSSVLSGWTNEANNTSGTTVRTMEWASKIKSAAGAEPDFTATGGASAISTNFMASFLQEPPSPPGPSSGSILLLGVG